jgi:hypothetical protein
MGRRRASKDRLKVKGERSEGKGWSSEVEFSPAEGSSFIEPNKLGNYKQSIGRDTTWYEQWNHRGKGAVKK